MAHFTKEQYQGKTEWAAKRMSENLDNSSLTTEQHDAVATICTLRHEAHTSFNQYWNPQGTSTLSNLFPSEWETDYPIVEQLIQEANLPQIIWSTKRTYSNSPSIEDFYEEIGDDMDEDEKNEILDDMKNELQETLNRLDQDVRDYLAYIDKVYGTNYAPARGNS